MRLTNLGNRLALAAVVAAWAASAGCQRLPYIDQSKAVPHENLGTIAEEDKEVKQAQFLAARCRPHAQGRPARAPPTTPRRRRSGR